MEYILCRAGIISGRNGETLIVNNILVWSLNMKVKVWNGILRRRNIWFIRHKLPNFRAKKDKAALFGFETVTATDSN